MGFLCSDPCTSALVMEVLTCSPSVWELMLINTLHPSRSRQPGSKSFIFSNTFRKLHPSLKYFHFPLFIFIPARCFYPAYPLHPPPTINNPDRCRDSSALLVWCFQTGISTIFKEQDTCASERAQLPERGPTPARGSAASSDGFLGEHPGFHVCSYFYSFEMLLLLLLTEALQVDIRFCFLNFF